MPSSVTAEILRQNTDACRREESSFGGKIMKIKLYAAVTVMLSLVAVASAQTKREGTTPPSHAAVQKNQLQEHRPPDSKTRVFEIRTYTTSQKMEVFMAFFTQNTMKLFRRHGFEPIGFWVPQDPPLSGNTFVYMLAFPDRETAKLKWDAFLNDPEWVTARADFMAKHGRVTDKIESQFVSPVDFSLLR
jgi:hypothetical protein